MINRELIRIKLVQVLYSYLQKGTHNPDVAEKELLLSLDKAYDLYNYLLLLMVEVSRMSVRMLEVHEKRSKKLKDGASWSHKFVDNRFIIQLESNRQLRDYCSEHELSWADHETFVRGLYNKVEESDFYKDYMASETSSFMEDREIWRRIYKQLIQDNNEIDAVLEDKSLYWNDDKEVVDTFVLKTIKRFEEKNQSRQELLQEYDNEEDKDYARKLFRATIMNADEYQHYMSEASRNWDFSRLAYMDIVIMQIAIAEMMTFPSIPVSVTINEYVDMAKLYSTPRSGGYINGMLDAIARHLIQSGRLFKQIDDRK